MPVAHQRFAWIAALLVALGFAGCAAGESAGPPEGTGAGGSGEQDGALDVEPGADGPLPFDGATPDGATFDSAGFDSAGLDSSSEAEVSSADSQVDSSPDGLFEAQADADASVDSSEAGSDGSGGAGGEAGVDSGGTVDSGGIDADAANVVDATSEDSASTGGEVWVQIDYTSAYTPESPQWSFSNTPGWGAAQWAQPPKTWPEAWDRWNNMTVETDPIGKSLTIGSSSELQLMIGLEELVSYTSMSVRLEGRSKATSSSVQFDVYNPLNNCGTTGSMSQDWSVHVVELDLGNCAVIGAGVQAVRVSPTNGTLALVRMKVTLHGATW